MNFRKATTLAFEDAD